MSAAPVKGGIGRRHGRPVKIGFVRAGRFLLCLRRRDKMITILKE